MQLSTLYRAEVALIKYSANFFTKLVFCFRHLLLHLVTCISVEGASADRRITTTTTIIIPDRHHHRFARLRQSPCQNWSPRSPPPRRVHPLNNVFVQLKDLLLHLSLCEGMINQILYNALNKGGYVFKQRHGICSFVMRRYVHAGQILKNPRSFFGIEDYVDDDNSRPYTYKKEKKSKNPYEKHISFKQRTIAYMEPFSLDVFISKRFVTASLTHRVTSKQVAVAGTNSKDIKAVLTSRTDIPACLAVGRILADRAREADVYTCTYTPRERDKFEGKIRAIVQSLIDNGIDVKVYLN